MPDASPISPSLMGVQFKLDKDYFAAITSSFWLYLGLSMGIIRLAEKWWNVTILLPHWAMISLAFLGVSLAQFEAYKKLHKRVQSGLSETPFSFRAEIDKAAPKTSLRASHTVIGGGPAHQPVEVPRIVLRVWKKKQPQDIEVTITRWHLENFQRPELQSTFPIHRVITDQETIEITEQLVKFIAGDPLEHQKLLRISEEIQVKLEYKLLSATSESKTCFRVKGRLNASRLELELENLPNPPTTVS